MKLRKQPGVKLAIVASTLALLGAVFAVVRANPQIDTEASAAPVSTPGSYSDFFFPAGTPTTDTQPAVAQPRPHTRTRAS